MATSEARAGVDERLIMRAVAAGPDAIIAADRCGVISFWNAGAERIFGFTAAQATGQSLDLIIPSRLRERHWAGWREVVVTGQGRHGAADLLAVPALRADGVQISVEFSIHCLVDTEGRLVGIAATLRDVSARFELTRELKRELAALTSRTEVAASRDVADPPTDELVAFEVATRDLVGVALRSVERLEVSLPQFRLLWVLRELGRCSSTECARALGVARSSVTRLADRLYASGHLTRGGDPANRSVVTLELTQRGRELVQRVIERRRHELGRVLDHLNPAQRTACAAVLREVHEYLSDASPDTPPHPMPL